MTRSFFIHPSWHYRLPTEYRDTAPVPASYRTVLDQLSARTPSLGNDVDDNGSVGSGPAPSTGAVAGEIPAQRPLMRVMKHLPRWFFGGSEHG